MKTIDSQHASAGTWIRRLLASALVAFAGSASAVVLPGSNAMTTTQYGDFQVYSLSLLQDCAAAGDLRCLPSGPLPVQSNAGFTATQLTVFSPENGNPQTTNQPVPLPPGTPADNVFESPAGNQSSTLVFGSATSPEPTPAFTGDRPGFWDVKISVLRTYLGTHDLVFIFDNSQEGDGIQQWLQIWGRAQIVDALGTEKACFELHGSLTTGCQPRVEPTNATTPGSYVTVYTSYCVDKITGVAYNLGTGTSQTCANSGGYYVNGNIGSANADNAAFSKALNDFVFAATTDGDWLLSLDIRTANNNGSGETLWICDNCDIDTTTRVPEPSSVALLGLALTALALRRRSTKAASRA